MMTYREKLFKEYPDYTEDAINDLCPWACGYVKTCPCYETDLLMSCKDCWDREVENDIP